MSDAIDSIVDIVEALRDYGSDISLIKVTYGGYDPISGGNTTTTVSTPLKAFLPNKTTSSILSNSQIVTTSSYDILFKFYTDEAINKTYKIEYQGKIYNILLIGSIVLQNETLLYEVVAKK